MFNICLKIDSQQYNKDILLNLIKQDIKFHIYDSYNENVINNILIDFPNSCVLHYSSPKNINKKYIKLYNNTKTIIDVNYNFKNDEEYRIYKYMVFPKIYMLNIHVEENGIDKVIYKINDINKIYIQENSYGVSFSYNYGIYIDNNFLKKIDIKNKKVIDTEESYIIYKEISMLKDIEKINYILSPSKISLSLQTNKITYKNKEYDIPKNFFEFYLKLEKVPEKCKTCESNIFCPKIDINNCQEVKNYYNIISNSIVKLSK